MVRDQCIDMLYAEVEKEIPISRTAYENSLYGWEISPIMGGGAQIGVLLLSRNEIHIQLQKPAALMYMRYVIRECAVRNLERYGHLVTRSLDDAAVIRFLDRLGFYRTGQEGQMIFFRLDKLKIK